MATGSRPAGAWSLRAPTAWPRPWRASAATRALTLSPIFATDRLAPYAIEHVRVEATAPSLPFTIGYMRGSPQRELAFFNESFIDELARRKGHEPLAFRMSLLGGNPRLAKCLQAAAQLGGWDGGGAGSNMGIAGCSAFGSHIALVASASIGPDQRVRVHKLAAAVDCGRLINSGLAQQQVEAGLLWAFAQAVAAAPEWVGGYAKAGPLSALGLPRIGDTPEISIRFIASRAKRRGASPALARCRSRRQSPTPSTRRRERGCAPCRSTLWRRHDPRRPSRHSAPRKSASCWSTWARPMRPTRLRSNAICANSSAIRG